MDRTTPLFIQRHASILVVICLFIFLNMGLAHGLPNEKIVTTFLSAGDGENPNATVTQAKSGTLYGTTGFGGAYGFGTVYSITTAGKLVVLHSFNGADGENPLASVMIGADGRLYGTAAYGGPGFAPFPFRIW